MGEEKKKGERRRKKLGEGRTPWVRD